MLASRALRWSLGTTTVQADVDNQSNVSQIRLFQSGRPSCQREFDTITGHDKPVAALVSIEAPKIPREAIEHSRSGLISYLRTFPGGVLKENRLRAGKSSFERLPARNQCRFDAGDHSRTGVEGIYRMAGKHEWS